MIPLVPQRVERTSLPLAPGKRRVPPSDSQRNEMDQSAHYRSVLFLFCQSKRRLPAKVKHLEKFALFFAFEFSLFSRFHGTKCNVHDANTTKHFDSE